MKRIIFSIVLFALALLSVTISKAQSTHSNYLDVNYLGWEDGYYTFVLTSHQSCTQQDFTYSVTGTQITNQLPNRKNYIGGNQLQHPDGEVFKFEAPFNPSGATFIFHMATICNSSLGANTDDTVTVNNVAGNLPIFLQAWSGKLVGDNLVFTWTVTMESNVDHYLIEYSKDSDFAVIASMVSLGDTQTERTYTATVTEPSVDYVFASLGVLASLGLGLAFLRRKNMMIPMAIIAIFSFSFTSCSKNNDCVSHINHKLETKSTTYFRLTEVDKDGNTWTSSIIAITKD